MRKNLRMRITIVLLFFFQVFQYGVHFLLTLSLPQQSQNQESQEIE